MKFTIFNTKYVQITPSGLFFLWKFDADEHIDGKNIFKTN